MKHAVLFLSLALAPVWVGVNLAAAGEKANPILELAKEKVADPKKPFTLVVTLTVKEGQEKAFEDAFKPAVAATRKEKGCIVYDLNRDLSERSKYYVYERWQSLAALEHHMQTEHIKKLLDTVRDLLAGPPDAKIFGVAGE
jgi:quinol monooxygenase YgiN